MLGRKCVSTVDHTWAGHPVFDAISTYMYICCHIALTDDASTNNGSQEDRDRNIQTCEKTKYYR